MTNTSTQTMKSLNFRCDTKPLFIYLPEGSCLAHPGWIFSMETLGHLLYQIFGADPLIMGTRPNSGGSD